MLADLVCGLRVIGVQSSQGLLVEAEKGQSGDEFVSSQIAIYGSTRSWIIMIGIIQKCRR